ncbi:MAG: hypothetical protein NW203_06645 [Hyphomonadaceae bacterium]|nr:hypothetical protein [Hyphomonadaceae bacterium]
MSDGPLSRLGAISTRRALRQFQAARGDDLDEGFQRDIEMLWHKDLDLAVKAGGLLAFDGLILGAGINPLAASPGAPISLDAATAPGPVVLVALGVALLSAAAAFCVRAVMIGEDVDDSGLDGDRTALVQRMLAAYCVAIDAQAKHLARASQLTYAGGGVMAVGFLWSLASKWL